MNTRQLIKYINDITNTIPIVHSFNDVDPYTYWNSQEVKYGSVIFAVRNSTQVGAVNRYNCIIYYGDRVLKDESNVNDIYSDAQSVIKHVLSNIELSDANMSVMEGTPVITFFRQRFLDDLAGGYCNFTIEDAEVMGACGYNNGVIVNPDAPIDYDKFSFNIVAVPNDSTIIINGEERSGVTATKGTLIEWSVSHPNYVTQTGALRLMGDVNKQVELEAVKYNFTVEPIPSDALVIINNEPRKTIRVEYGETVTWAVSKQGYEDQVGTHVVTGDYTQNVELTPVKHSFTINPIPNDATVVINGVERKSITADYGTPITWSVSREGYTSRTGSSVIGLVDETINVGLVINQYTLTIASTPADATVTINGERRNSITADYGTPISWVVEAVGHITQSGNTVLSKDSTISVNLEAVKYDFSIESTPADATVIINGQERTSITADYNTLITWSVKKTGYAAQSGTLNLTSNFKQIVNLAILQCTFTVSADDIFKVIINGEERRSITADYGTYVEWSVSADHYQTATGSTTLYKETDSVSVEPLREQYTFTINPTPSDATVTIDDQERNSITVPYESVVTWSVSKEGYNTQSGSEKMIENKTMSVNLSIQQFTFAISATPADATVIINGQNQSSAVVNYGDTVTWEVSRTGYHTQSSSRVVTGDITWVVNLVPESYEYAINPTPSDATVLINGVKPTPDQTIHADYGSYVEWSVSKEGFVTQSGRDYITGPVSKNVELARQQYTFSINTDSANTVIINGEERRSITADFETPIDWRVSRTGYDTQSGSYILNGNHVEIVQLVLSRYTFSINTDPANTVIINDQERASITADYGTTITWSVSRTGYDTQSNTFVLSGDDTIEVVLQLEKFTFTINPNPSNAIVTMNGIETQSINVESGTTVDWTVEYPGYKDQSGSVVVTGDSSMTVTLDETYLKFYVNEPGYVGWDYNNTAPIMTYHNIEYSIDDGNTWNEWPCGHYLQDRIGSDNVKRFNAGDVVLIRGNAEYYAFWTSARSWDKQFFSVVTMEKDSDIKHEPISLNIGGDITSLLGTYDRNTLHSYAFAGLFQGFAWEDAQIDIDQNDPLVLSSRILGDSCYSHMFTWAVNDGVSITRPPIIKAVEVAESCCYGMFEGCRNLTSAPTLMAKVLKPHCYGNMFKGCNNLSLITCYATDVYSEGCVSFGTPGERSSGVPSTGILHTDVNTSWPNVPVSNDFNERLGIWYDGIPVKWSKTSYNPTAFDPYKSYLSFDFKSDGSIKWERQNYGGGDDGFSIQIATVPYGSLVSDPSDLVWTKYNIRQGVTPTTTPISANTTVFVRVYSGDTLSTMTSRSFYASTNSDSTHSLWNHHFKLTGDVEVGGNLMGLINGYPNMGLGVRRMFCDNSTLKLSEVHPLTYSEYLDVKDMFAGCPLIPSQSS